jgi:hypothetical protein
VFVEEIIPMLPERWIDNEQLFNMVEEYIGSSKLVVLSQNNDNSAYILNEGMGHWSSDKKIWFSNKSYTQASCNIIVHKGSGWKSPELFDSPAVPMSLPQCMMCNEAGVFDDVCYECETCQLCGYIAWTDECCVGMNGKIHSSTQAEWEKIQESMMWGMQ